MEPALLERADMYRAAIGNARQSGDAPRLRRLERGLKVSPHLIPLRFAVSSPVFPLGGYWGVSNHFGGVWCVAGPLRSELPLGRSLGVTLDPPQTLENMLVSVRKGKPINEEEIPPPVALGKGGTPPQPPGVPKPQTLPVVTPDPPAEVTPDPPAEVTPAPPSPRPQPGEVRAPFPPQLRRILPRGGGTVVPIVPRGGSAAGAAAGVQGGGAGRQTARGPGNGHQILPRGEGAAPRSGCSSRFNFDPNSPVLWENTATRSPWCGTGVWVSLPGQF